MSRNGYGDRNWIYCCGNGGPQCSHCKLVGIVPQNLRLYAHQIRLVCSQGERTCVAPANAILGINDDLLEAYRNLPK